MFRKLWNWLCSLWEDRDDNALMEYHASHNWSGWPGAWCMDCGEEDEVELAIGVGDYDPYTAEWVNAANRSQYKFEKCKCPGSNQHNPYVKGTRDNG